MQCRYRRRTGNDGRTPRKNHGHPPHRADRRVGRAQADDLCAPPGRFANLRARTRRAFGTTRITPDGIGELQWILRRSPPHRSSSGVPSFRSCCWPLPFRAAIFLGRNNVRSRRRDLVRDLVNLFGFAKDPQGEPIIIPPLELVKWKYDPHPRYDPDRVTATGEAPEAPGLISFWYFLLPTCIYILFTCIGFCLSFLPIIPGHPTPFS